MIPLIEPQYYPQGYYSEFEKQRGAFVTKEHQRLMLLICKAIISLADRMLGCDEEMEI